MLNRGIQNYRKTSVLTADRKRLVLMCYEGAIDHLRMGKKKYGEKDFEGKARAFAKALDIIQELRSSLDFAKGGTLAKNLDALYGYVLRGLLDADIKRDMGALDEIVWILCELKSAWEETFYNQETPVTAQAGSVSDDVARVSHGA